MITRRFSLAGGAVLLVAVTAVSVVHGQIYNWNTGEVIPGTEGITPGPGMELSYWNTDSHNLRYADLSGGLDLHGSRYSGCWLDHAWFMGANLTDSHFGIDLLHRPTTLVSANFSGANATGALFHDVALISANLSEADLTNANFAYSTLTGANLSGATIVRADFRYSTGLTASQLASTASYQAGDLRGIGLEGYNLSGWNLANQNLTNARFGGATLSNTDFTGATVAVASLWSTTSDGFTKEQLYSTASYQAGDLHGIHLGSNDLSGWNLADQNLSGANFGYAMLTDADLSGAHLTNASFSKAGLSQASLSAANLTGACLEGAILTDADLSGSVITGANFSRDMGVYPYSGTGLTTVQLQSTASYAAGDLQGVRLDGSDLTGCNLANQVLTDASFLGATLTNVDLSGATVVGADFSKDVYLLGTGLTAMQLESTASHAARDLRGIRVAGSDLTACNLANQNLTDASFAFATLSNADLRGAIVVGADFLWDRWQMGEGGLTAAQLYSTASYQAGDLHGIGLGGNDLTGWNLANQNLTDAEFWDAMLTNADLSGAHLTNAIFHGTTLTNADLSRADTRGADLAAYQLAFAIADNTILPDGRVAGLNLGVGDTLKVRDYARGYYPYLVGVTIDDAFHMDAASTLEIILTDESWGSTVSLADGFLADLDGTLALTFAPGTDVNSLLGVTFDLFNWNGGLLPGDTFASIQWPAGFDWDLSDLYLGGHVTLTAVPEPATVLLLSLGALALRGRRQRGMSLRAVRPSIRRNR